MSEWDKVEEYIRNGMTIEAMDECFIFYRRMSQCNHVFDMYKDIYKKLQREEVEAKENDDYDREWICEALMRQMRRVIALLHNALERNEDETI